MRTKIAFLGQKTWSSKSLKIDFFSRRVNTKLWSKNGHFSNFFFRQYKPGKCLLRYSKTKKTFLGYKKRRLKSLKNDIFSSFWTSCLYSLERCVFVLEYRKRHFPMLYCLKKSLKNSHFWSNSMEKCQFLDFLNFLFLQPRKAFFCSRIS